MTAETAIDILEEIKILDDSIYSYNEDYMNALNMAIEAIKKQNLREPHYTILKYIIGGSELAIKHPECPRCYDNGLVLYDAEIERGVRFVNAVDRW